MSKDLAGWGYCMLLQSFGLSLKIVITLNLSAGLRVVLHRLADEWITFVMG